MKPYFIRMNEIRSFYYLFQKRKAIDTSDKIFK